VSPKPKVLVVDDEEAIRSSAADDLRIRGVRVPAGRERPGRLKIAERKRPTSCSSTSRCRRWTGSRS
jgi:hypothetical protein